MSNILYTGPFPKWPFLNDFFFFINPNRTGLDMDLQITLLLLEIPV